MGRTQTVAFAEQNEIFKYLKDVSDYAALTPEQRDDYEAALMRARDYNAVLMTATEKAMAEGIEKGIEKGIEQGVAEGRKQEKFELARKMMAVPYPIDAVMQLTGLTIEELNNLTSIK